MAGRLRITSCLSSDLAAQLGNLLLVASNQIGHKGFAHGRIRMLPSAEN
jgi:hypothetical protein